MPQKDFVSIIILNWNNQDVIENCLQSALSQSYAQCEIILVDNGSTDDSPEIIQKYKDKIQIIKNKKNLGFAQGVNIGIQHSKGEFIALLNSDAVADAAWIEKMVQAIKTSSAGMVASKIFLADQYGVLDNTGLVLSPDGQNRARGRLQKDQGQYDKKKEALCPSGCAGLYRQSMLEEIHYLDEKFFAYGEDLDIGLRGRIQGYTCVYEPSAIVYHKLSASTGAVSPFKTFYVERNRTWVLLKCFPLKHLVFSIWHTILRYVYHTYGVLRRKGPSYRYTQSHSFLSLVFILLKAQISTLVHLPYLLMERRRIMQSAKALEEFDQWFRDHGISVKDAALSEVI